MANSEINKGPAASVCVQMLENEIREIELVRVV